MPTIHLNRLRSTLTLAGLVASCVAAHTSTGQVVINEFFFRDPDTRLEYIEVLNRSTTPIDLRDLAISDERKITVPVTAQYLVMNSGEYLVFVRDSTAFDARFESERLEVPRWPALNNEGDTIYLWLSGIPVDSVSFDGTWGAYGRSVERIDPNGASASASNWSASLNPAGGTPGFQNSVFSPDATPPKVLEIEEWVDHSVIVYLDEPIERPVLSRLRFTFTLGDRPRDARLSEDGTRIILEPWSGANLSSLTIEGLEDASGNSAGPVAKSIARQPTDGDVILNEILYEPIADDFDGRPDQYEFVEIRSLVDHPLAMRRAYLTGPTRENGTSDTLRSDDRPMRLHGRGFGIFYAAGTGSASLRGAFPSLPPDSVIFSGPIHRASLLLDNGGDVIRLHSAAGALLDELSYEPSWHLPERSVTRGVSLERISPIAPTDDSANWTSSVADEGATPGRENSVALAEAVAGRSVLSVEPSPFSPDGDGWEDFTRIGIRTGRAASSIAVWVYDATGRFVRSLADGLPVGSETSLVWDGRNEDGRRLAAGIFIVYVEAVDTRVGDVRTFKAPVVVAYAL